LTKVLDGSEWLTHALAALTQVKGHTVPIQQQDVSSNAKAKFCSRILGCGLRFMKLVDE
jgi:hypothetical protein